MLDRLPPFAALCKRPPGGSDLSRRQGAVGHGYERVQRLCPSSLAVRHGPTIGVALLQQSRLVIRDERVPTDAKPAPMRSSAGCDHW